MADDTALPKAPTDSICISINIGKTRAMAASGVLPSCPTYQTSVKLTVDCTINATLLGMDNWVSNGSAGAVRRYWVRLSIAHHYGACGTAAQVFSHVFNTDSFGQKSDTGMDYFFRAEKHPDR